jgi:predicted RNA-binding Zn-ribbon protein involved in translation (DUF1610 family)
MDTKQKTKGSWGVRFFILLLGIVLGVLFFWLLSFIEGDIGQIKQPDHHAVRQTYIEPSLDRQAVELGREIDAIKREMQTLTEQQRLLSSSTSSLQNTISQLLTIQKESLAKNVEFSEKSKQTLQDSQAAFLDNQQKYQAYNRDISELTAALRQKEDIHAELVTTIREKEVEADKEFREVYQKYRFRVAVLKLSFLVPVFVAASFLFLKFRSGPYWALVWAAFLASFVKMAMVAHEYFPSRYFKYVALLVIIGIVLRFLITLIKMIISPKTELLIKQYQQHYDKCLCPVCGKPIRSGPLRFIGALGKKAQVAAGAAQQEPYTCPSCGTGLYGKCSACGTVRHTLLPYCEHCGDATVNVNL